MVLIAVQIGNATATETGIEAIMGEDTTSATVIETVTAIATEGDTIPIVGTAATAMDGGHPMILVDYERLLVEGTLQGKVDITTPVSGRHPLPVLPHFLNCRCLVYDSN
jgi:hypothetical protein